MNHRIFSINSSTSSGLQSDKAIYYDNEIVLANFFAIQRPCKEPRPDENRAGIKQFEYKTRFGIKFLPGQILAFLNRSLTLF